ncbi:MAG: chemotaxis protein CheW [Actinomycetota bacterium]|nr:chemotaxis protein CheW [Actinomycetota bacterium]
MEISTITQTTQYLTFRLGEETFAIEISRVREVLDFSVITKVPGTPDFVRGVINLRGNVVPVVDMRLKFGMTRTEKTVNTCVIIIEINFDGEAAVLGALADSVQEVMDLGPDQVEAAPKIGMRLNSEFIKGLGKRTGPNGERFVIILDTDKVFSGTEMAMVEEAGAISDGQAPAQPSL